MLADLFSIVAVFAALAYNIRRISREGGSQPAGPFNGLRIASLMLAASVLATAIPYVLVWRGMALTDDRLLGHLATTFMFTLFPALAYGVMLSFVERRQAIRKMRADFNDNEQ